jgi:hypothetical protein
MRNYHREWAHSGSELVIPNAVHGMRHRIRLSNDLMLPVLGIGASSERCCAILADASPQRMLAAWRSARAS